MKIRDFVKILEANGFYFKDQRGSHQKYEGHVGGERRMVTVDGNGGMDILPNNFQSMIRQSGLPKKLFK